MIAFIEGTLIKKTVSTVVIATASGLGYELFVPITDLEQMPANGSKVLLHTYLQVKEDGVALFGFLEEEALSVFEKLKKVSGIGSKTALGVLAHMSPSEVCVCIANEDSTLLSKIPGVGPKTAARIILELKDKILKDDNVKLTKIASKKETTNVSKNEAVLALKVLGYTTTQINEAIDEINIEALKVEEIIKKVLGVINKR